MAHPANLNAHDARQAAIDTCMAYNDYAPATLVEAVEDGFGDTLVWLEDRDGDLWMCNADAYGTVYINTLITGDLLEGEGYHLAVHQEGGFGAESLCVAVLEEFLEETALHTIVVPDGLGDYLVWLETSAGNLWACNASDESILYAFEPVDGPINGFDHFEMG